MLLETFLFLPSPMPELVQPPPSKSSGFDRWKIHSLVTLHLINLWNSWKNKGKKDSAKSSLWMKTHPCSPHLPPTSPFCKFILTWTNVKYFSPVKRLIEKQGYHENTAYFKEADVWCHWHILLPVIIIISPLFTAWSFQHIHSYTLAAPAPAQPSQVPERQATYLPFLCHQQAKKTAPLPLKAGEIAREKSKAA